MPAPALKVGRWIYTPEDLLRLATAASITCDSVVWSDGVLDTLDPTLPEGEQMVTLNLFQEDATALGFKGPRVGGLGHGICWIPVQNAALEDMGMALTMRTVADIVNQRLGDLYHMVDGASQDTESRENADNDGKA